MYTISTGWPIKLNLIKYTGKEDNVSIRTLVQCVHFGQGFWKFAKEMADVGWISIVYYGSLT